MKALASMSPFMKRVALGKTLGLVFGLSGLAYLVFYTDTSMQFAFGMLLWYMMTGVVIGAFGVMNKHPLLGFKMNWVFRWALFGGFMFLALALVWYDVLGSMLSNYGSWFKSPYWIIVDGMFFGLITDYFATKCYWEGKKLFK